ncbi:MAG: CHASE2 domain-containing protein, partial [Okeania sp. SIO4D6]|nr:CHASE2 domain-containing protein [Okeania sp. SIO4D6]
MAIKIMHPIHFVKWIYKKVHSYGIPIPAILASGAAIVSLLFFRHLGGLQRLELVVFDGMVRLGPDNISDSRLLIVELTEEDIQYLGQWPISDKNLADVLASLQKHQPKVIGVDFYRDVPKYPGYTELVEQLQKPNVFGITFIGDRSVSTTPPPPSMPKERIGFNNIPFDPDAVVRRYSLFINNDEETMVAFALHLALAYLQEYEISPQITENNEYQLGDAIFKKLQPNSGGYQQIDAQGYPILINYRNSRSIAPKITIKDVLLGNFDPELVKNKIVIIGNTAPSSNDFSFTPYSYSLKLKMSGVEIHAQATSQIISAVLDDQKLFWYWDESTEILWILSWSIVGGHIAWHIRRPFILLLINI